MTDIETTHEKLEEAENNGGAFRIRAGSKEILAIDVSRLRFSPSQVIGMGVVLITIVSSHLRLEATIQNNSADRFPASVAVRVAEETERLNSHIGFISPSRDFIRAEIDHWRKEWGVSPHD